MRLTPMYDMQQLYRVTVISLLPDPHPRRLERGTVQRNGKDEPLGSAVLCGSHDFRKLRSVQPPGRHFGGRFLRWGMLQLTLLTARGLAVYAARGALRLWYSTWGTSTPGGTRRYLTWYIKLKRKCYFVINNEQSGPDLGLATGNPDVRTFDYQVRSGLL
jgi:hypothetical protein